MYLYWTRQNYGGNYWLLGFTSFPGMLFFIVKWYPVSFDGALINHMCYLIDGYSVYRCVTVMKGGQFAYVSVPG